MTAGEIIRSARKAKGYSQAELAEKLSRHGVNVTNQAIAKWEKNLVILNADQLTAVCIELGIEDFLSEATDGKYGLSSGLSREGRQKLMDYRKILVASGLYSPYHHTVPQQLRSLPLYSIAVSAGTGQFLDGENYEMIEVGEDIPMEANFAVRIAGDSMEPEYHDGQIVFVRQQQSLMSGQIGIFLYDGSAYIKQFVPGDGIMILHSFNPKYEDIQVSPLLQLRVLGKVLPV